MKINDVVMFTNQGRYAKWFYGQIGVITRISKSKSGEEHCRVQWMQPVPYFEKFSTISDFPLSYFEIP